jgi:manganese/zinc/iron transport system permease protein
VAFILMVALGGDGRNLAAFCSARRSRRRSACCSIQWIVARTRLTEDAAIGAVLGVFFGFGIVLLTVIQSMSSGRQAGLEDFLLGSTAGMLRQDAIVILAGGALALALIWGLRRPMTLVAFDPRLRDGGGIQRDADRPDHDGLGPCRHGDRPEGRGPRPHRRAVDHPAGRGAVLDRQVGRMIWISQRHRRRFGLRRRGGLGLRSGPSDRTDHRPRRGGHLRSSLFFAPVRGLAASVLQQRHFKARVHHRQGLLALARQEPIREAYTLRCCSAKT